MVGTVWPHRLAMTWGLVLGFGVALTYATSLAGMLPVLSVLVERKAPREYVLQWADKASAKGAFYSGWLRSIAEWLPGTASDAQGGSLRTLAILLGILLAINLLGNLFRVFSQYLVLYASQRAVMDLRRRMYRKALSISMTRLSGELSGIISQFLSDVREVFLGIVTLFGKVAREPLKALCVLAVALLVDSRLTLMALAIAPPAVLLLWYFGRKIRKAAVRLLEGYGMMLGSLEETLQGIQVVKSYGQEARERRRMWQLERRMLHPQLRLFWIESLSSPLIEVVGIIAASAAVVWLASRVFSGEIDASRFLLMVGLLAAMLDPIRKIANVYNMVQRSGAAAQRIFAFLDEPEEDRQEGIQDIGPAVNVLPAAANKPDSTSQDKLPAAPQIKFSKVGFRYDRSSAPALADVTLTIAPGECVAIVGPNGSGKSTLLRLLPRLLEPQQGAISIDGLDVRAMRLKPLRKRIAIVDQRAVVFARSVSENIAYGSPAAGDREVRRAAALAYAADFIEQLPEGYATRVGEFGTTLSGGQRQRLSIARAFLKPADILIFDEATSEIDAESESKIHAALQTLRRGKTTFLIAHRHTVMEMADRVIVMDVGRVVDAGPHAALLDRCPLYQALYASPGAGASS